MEALAGESGKYSVTLFAGDALVEKSHSWALGTADLALAAVPKVALALLIEFLYISTVNCHLPPLRVE